MDVRLPDGTVITNVPDGITQTELMSSLRKKRAADEQTAERERLNQELTGSMSTTEKLLAGAGKSFVDIGRSAKRLANMAGIGGYDQAAAQADADLDKPLMDTSAGAWGKGLTDAALTLVPGLGMQNKATQAIRAGAQYLPRATAAATRAAAPYIGAAGAGATVGAAVTPEDMAGGAGMGAAAGAAGELGGRVLSAGYSGAKAALEPLYESGRRRVLARTLNRFAQDPAAARAAAAAPVEYVPGVTPTLAEATMDPGLAQLQRAAMASSNDIASALAQARQRQSAGYRGALDELAGNDGQREFFEQARGRTADALFGQARTEGLQMTPELQARAQSLMQRPAVQQAMAEAQQNALNRGTNLADPAGSVEGLQRVKEALDSQISRAMRAGDNDAASALRNSQEELLSFLDLAAPAHGEARRTFAAMSRPINQMDIAQALRDKAIPALADVNPALARVNANSYANALRNADQVARTATGMRSATMEGVMDPAQMQTIRGIEKDMGRYAAAQELARVPGSPTAQYMGAQNVIRQFLGPLGIPQSAVDSMAGRVASGMLNIPFVMTKGQTEEMLSRALTDPRFASQIMSTTDPRTIAEMLRPYAAQVAVQSDTQ